MMNNSSRKMIILESVLDDIPASEDSGASVSLQNGKSGLRPGEWQLCLMCPDWTSAKRRVIEGILDVYADEWNITGTRECPGIDDVTDGGRLGSLSGYDAAMVEFTCPDTESSLKCLFYILYQSEWCAAFVEDSGKWTFLQDNEDACSAVRSLVLCGKIKLDVYGNLNSRLYGMLWPDETFDVGHADELERCMRRIKERCARLHSKRGR